MKGATGGGAPALPVSLRLVPDPRVQRRQHHHHQYEAATQGGHQRQRVGRVVELVREGAVLAHQPRPARRRRPQSRDDEQRPRQHQRQQHGQPGAQPRVSDRHLTTERVAHATVAVHGDDDEDAVGGEGAEEREEAQQAAGEFRGEGEVEAEVGDLGGHGDEADDEVEQGQAHDEEVLRGHAELNPVHVDHQPVPGDPHGHQNGHVHHGGAHRARESLVFAPQIPVCVIIVIGAVTSLGKHRRQVPSLVRVRDSLGSPTERLDVMQEVARRQSLVLQQQLLKRSLERGGGVRPSGVTS